MYGSAHGLVLNEGLLTFVFVVTITAIVESAIAENGTDFLKSDEFVFLLKLDLKGQN